jgi:uncharacterized protein YbbK (DUF523 family)
MSKEAKIIVSACLAGEKCRYDGKSKAKADIVKLVKAGKAIPLCPEILGGLPVPRDKAQIDSGDGNSVLKGKSKVITVSGADVTEEYVKGAFAVLKVARKENVKKAVLKSKSPSCGVTVIVKDDKLAAGIGVTAALLKKHGIEPDEI